MWWRSAASLSLTALGERRRALELAREELERARGWGTERAIGRALRGLGNAEGGGAGLGHLREASAALARSEAPVEHAAALVDLGAALRRAGRIQDPRPQLRAALDLAHRHGAIGVANQARAELVVAGGKPRRDALRGRDALTAAELRVARLAAAGQTNRQIAQSLFVTLRTVEHHLSSTYGKLDIASRKQLAIALERSSG